MVKKTNLYKIICFVLILLNLGLIIHRAWFKDDSFIMFRTLDNFVHGYGLTWNIYERVQAYTSPLWLFFLTPIYALTHEIYFTVLSVCVVLSALALSLLFITVEDKRQLIVPLVALAVSNAYINFSTSGLENSLLNFLCILFLFVYVKKPTIRHFYLILLLISSLIALTRLDALLIVLPALVYLFITDQRKFLRKLLTVIVGFSPLILWEAFSLFYYGFLFPNTFYAKLYAGMPLTDYLHRGLVYFLDTVTRDPVTALGLIACFASFFFISKKLKPLVLGIFFYFLYAIYIGGDFMSGRMYSSIFFMAMALIAQNQLILKNWLIVTLSALLILIGFFSDCPTPFLNYPTPISNTVYRIMDERRFYQPGTGLFRNNHLNNGIEMDPEVWSFGGYTWIVKERATGTIGDMDPLIRVSTGFLGYFGGPQLKIIDEVGLSDPLIARLPAKKNPEWRVGHLYRVIPDGYKGSITNPKIKITDPKIELYNEHLKILTQRHLILGSRILEIIRFNLGYYNYLLK